MVADDIDVMDRIQFKAPPIYHTWFEDAVKIIGGNPLVQLDEITFYRIVGYQLPKTYGCGIGAVTAFTKEGVSITFASALIDTRWIVVHEFIHALSGETGHPEYWFERYGLMAEQH